MLQVLEQRTAVIETTILRLASDADQAIRALPDPDDDRGALTKAKDTITERLSRLAGRSEPLSRARRHLGSPLCPCSSSFASGRLSSVETATADAGGSDAPRRGWLCFHSRRFKWRGSRSRARTGAHQRRLGVVGLRTRRQRELGDRARAKDEAVGRAAKLEITELLTLPDVIPRRRLRMDQARGDLRHANRHDAISPMTGSSAWIG